MSYQEAVSDLISGKYQDSIEKFLIYLKKYPKDPDAFFNLGIGYMKINDNYNALLNFRKVIELIPNDNDSWNLMIKLYKEIYRDYEKAELCMKHILPEVPFKEIKVPEKIEEKLVNIEEEEEEKEVKLPLVIIDANFLIKLFEIKKERILYELKKASEIFTFLTSDQICNEFKNNTNYKNNEIYKIIDVDNVEYEHLYEFEKKIIKACPLSQKIKQNHEHESSWYNDLTLPYIFLQQDSKKIILVTDDYGLQTICKELKLNCQIMNSEEFWTYLKYRIRKKYDKLFYMK